jgi:hypothetical protein
MGHLINPTGFRVGYFSNWADLWSTSNNFVYAELLHNTISLRRAMGFFFENLVTDRYSMLYSHFTVESLNLSSLKLKMYFYDGIVEQKITRLVHQLEFFKFKKIGVHRRLLRRFRKVKSVSSIRIGFLRLWRYYDYLTARQIIFFFIYFLKIGSGTWEEASFTNLVSYYYKVFDKKWLEMNKKHKNISISAFIKYYVKFLVLMGFDSRSKVSSQLHVRGLSSNFSSFFKALDRSLHFWRQHQNFFTAALWRGKFLAKKHYKRFLDVFGSVDRFASQFFTNFYRLYLSTFRQPKFFRFMTYVLLPVFRSFGALDTKLEFFGLSNETVSSIFLARYLVRKIEMRFQIKELFSPIGKELSVLMKNTSAVLGYKLQFVGRLTRRGRVCTTWHLGGSIPTSKMSAQVEHGLYVGILRNGLCSVRVWLYRHKSFGNYNYNFLYKVNLSDKLASRHILKK